ncbi:SapC family protein [Aliarcobacter cryaerophilus]|uniref:SapC family protein n=1 Tax=Aliarcobacter cryaerophilus TaxID=28198 RepID=UPI003DA57715
MPKYKAITKQDHLNSSYTPPANYNYTKNDTVVPLLAAELSAAVPYYPIGFIKQNERYQLIVIQSLTPQLNLFVNEFGQYLVPYIVSYYRSYPFRLLPNENAELTLCYDEEANSISNTKEDGEIPLFTEKGDLSEKLNEILEFLGECDKNKRETQFIVDQLASCSLIETWNINVDTVNDSTHNSVEGLYTINEAKLKSLDPEILSTLAKSGALGLAYAQLLSQARLTDFAKRYSYYSKQKAAGSESVDLDMLFGDGDTIKF